MEFYDIYWEVSHMVKMGNEDLEQSVSIRTVLTGLTIGWDKDTCSSFLCSR